jgi:hypothetical protein
MTGAGSSETPRRNDKWGGGASNHSGHATPLGFGSEEFRASNSPALRWVKFEDEDENGEGGGSVVACEHGVYDDAGHGDVEPDRKSKSRQAAVSGKTAGERQKESDQDHRQSHDGEADVRDEQWEIEVANQTLALKTHVAVEGVIGDIGHEGKRPDTAVFWAFSSDTETGALFDLKVDSGGNRKLMKAKVLSGKEAERQQDPDS